MLNTSVTALGQPLRKRLPASDWADPQILRRSRGKRQHHGDDVCGGSFVCVDGTFRAIPTVGILRSGSFSFPPESFLLPPELFRTQIGVKLFNSLTPKSVLAGTKNSRSEGFLLTKHKHTNIPTMMERFPPPAPWF
jgi:hypothetical protein